MRRLFLLSGIVLAACSGGSPTGPTMAPPDDATARALGSDAVTTIGSRNGDVSATNSAPQIDFRVKPRPVGGVVAGPLPFDVKINLCESSDADAGDSLRFDVDWGDGFQTGQHHPGAGTDFEDGGVTTGCGGPDCCRHRHRFDRAGTFTVTATVSDKHLEDQGREVSGLAITTATVTVKAGFELFEIKGSCSHDLCVTGGLLTSGCHPCATTIIGVDPYCGAVEWDGICVDEVLTVCGLTC